MKILKKYAREPLFHFVAIGLILFYLMEAWYPVSDSDSQSPTTIAFDEEKIIQFLQYQNKTFNQDKAKAKWLAMSDHEKSQLMNDYVREEVMYREALALGLEEDDQIIRRRLIQKVEFINRGFQSDLATISETEIESFFKQHQQEYTIDPSITFTHVFIDQKTNGDQTLAIAQKTLTQLNSKQVPFEQAAQFGQRFYFHRNYVDRTPAFIESHFGDAFSKAAFKLTNTSTWHGPITSKYGQHLIMVSKNQASRLPQLDEVAGQVLEHLQRIKQRDLKQASLKKMVDKYQLKNSTGFAIMETKTLQEQQAHAN